MSEDKVTINFMTPRSESILADRIYGGTSFVVGDYDPEKRVFQEQSYASCRDIVANFYQKWACGGLYRNDAPFSKNPFNRTTFVLCTFDMSDATFERHCKYILGLLHPFEKELHWKRTKIFYGSDVNLSFNKKKREQAAFVLGSKCWVQNPIFLFPYLAVFKGVMYDLFGEHEHNEKLRNTPNLEEYFKYLAQHKKQQYSKAGKWMDVIRDRRKLFKDFTRKDLSSVEREEGKPKDPAYAMGIHSLLTSHLVLKGMISSKTGVSLYERINEWEKNRK